MLYGHLIALIDLKVEDNLATGIQHISFRLDTFLPLFFERSQVQHDVQ